MVNTMNRKHEYNFRGKLAVELAKSLPQFNPEWDDETKRAWWDALGALAKEGVELARMHDNTPPTTDKGQA